MGLDVYLYPRDAKDDENISPVEIDSAKYPDHMFKIGYFRSSYNDGGINSIGRQFGLPDLYDIFEPPDDYSFKPDWKSCLGRAKDAVDQWRKYAGENKLYVDQVNFYDNPEIDSKQSALKCFADAVADQDKSPVPFEAWSCRQGFFTPVHPQRVVGVIKTQIVTVVICCGAQYLISP